MSLIERVRRWPLTRYVPSWVKRSIRKAHALTTARAVNAAQPTASEIEAFVVRIYQLALGRVPGKEERDLWTAQVLAGQLSAARLMEVIAVSPEAAAVQARNQGEIESLVVRVYQLALGRTPGTEERDLWIAQVQAGHLSTARLVEVIASSPEATAALGQNQSEIDALVVRVYQLALGRTPGTAERDLWTEEVLGGQLSAARLVEVIAASPEAAEVRARHQLVPEVSNGRFVQFTYEYLLGRGAMASEIVHWDHRLNNEGLRRDQIVLALFAQRAAEALTDAAKPTPYDPSLAHVMGTDRFISVKEWQDTAATVPMNPAIADSKCYSSLKLQPSDEVLVSAVASLYRGGDFIEQFLENITSQTIFSQSELIIIDADSPENEFAVIARYMQRFPNIVYHRASTRIGIYEAWNLGVHLSKGRYITNTNLDDLRRIDSLERQAEILEKFPFVDVAYQDFYFSFEGHASFDRSAAVGVRSEVPIITPYNLMQSNSPHNAPMWRRTVHDDVGMFDASFRSAGDYDFWLRCVLAHKTFFKIDDPHVIYFVNPEGLSTQPNTRGIDEANRITKAHGRHMISPWLVTDDATYACEVARLAGMPAEGIEATRTELNWRYHTAQRALRRLSIDSRPHAAE